MEPSFLRVGPCVPCVQSSFSYVYCDFCFCKTGRCLTRFLWEETQPSKQNNDLKVLGSIFSSTVDWLCSQLYEGQKQNGLALLAFSDCTAREGKTNQGAGTQPSGTGVLGGLMYSSALSSFLKQKNRTHPLGWGKWTGGE